MSIVTVKKRDKERTKGKILSAVGGIIELHGVEKVGVNLVARTSGVNKALVYRYFESVDKLIQEYLKKSDLHVFACGDQAGNMLGSELDVKVKDLTRLMLVMLHDLRNNAQVRSLLSWEMQSGKSVLSDARNQVTERILQKLGQLPRDQDTGALLAMVTAGIYYLAIASDQQDKIIDVDLRSEQGWKRIENIIERIITSVIFYNNTKD